MFTKRDTMNKLSGKIARWNKTRGTNGNVMSKKSKLSVQLIVLFLSFALIPQIINSIIILNTTGRSARESFQQYSEIVVGQLTSNVDTGIAMANATMLSIANDSEVEAFLRGHVLDNRNVKFNARSRIDELNTRLTDTDALIDEIYIFFEDEMIYNLENRRSDQFQYLKSEEFMGSEEYKGIVQKDISWFYIGEEDSRGIYVSKKINFMSRYEAYALARVKNEYFIEALNNANIDDEIPIMIMDQNGVVLFSNNDSLIGDKYPDHYEAYVEQLKSSDEYAFTEVSDKGIFTLKETENGWLILTETPNAVLLQDFTRAGRNSVVMMGLIMIIVVAIGIFVGNKISYPIIKLTSYIKELKKGKLNIEEEEISSINVSNVETELLVEGFTQMLMTLKNLIGDAKELTHTINQNTYELEEIASNTALSSEQISEAIDNVSVGTQNQAYEIEKAMELMERLSSNVDKVTYRLDEVKKESKIILNNSSITESQLEELSGQANKTLDIAGNISSSVNSLGDEASKILEIMQMINNVNAQTNLLALNAAIEAAHAGDKGNGFGVIAEEIRGLSRQTGESIEMIKELVMNIEDKKHDALKETNKAVEIFEQQLPIIENTTKTFSKIQHQMKQADSGIVDANKILEQTKTEKELVGEGVTKVLGVVQHSAAIAEEVSAQTIQQKEYANNTSNLSKELLDRIQMLSKTYSKFE